MDRGLACVRNKLYWSMRPFADVAGQCDTVHCGFYAAATWHQVVKQLCIPSSDSLLEETNMA